MEPHAIFFSRDHVEELREYILERTSCQTWQENTGSTRKLGFRESSTLVRVLIDKYGCFPFYFILS
jgi:hypothetical protein